MILSFVTKECNVFIRFDNGVGIGNFGKEPLRSFFVGVA